MESKNKKKDPVQQFLELRKNLKQERMELVEQIKRIDDALASTMNEAKKTAQYRVSQTTSDKTQ